MSDELDGIFDNLKPEDFEAETTAFAEISRTNKGLEAFNAFVDEQIRALQMAYATSRGDLYPVAVLANPEIQRMFICDDKETLGNYIDRLHDEAMEMEATWFFFSRATEVATSLVEPEKVKDATLTDPKKIKKMKKKNVLRPGVFWYAERIEDERTQRLGIFFDNGDGILEKPIEAPRSVSGQTSAPMERVLRR